MVSTLREALRLGLVASVAFASPQALAQQPYYKGKRLSVMVNFAPGGSTDIEGRLFARHVARHIEGEPSVVVQNMDGAGGFNGAAYVGEIAPKDGTMVGFLGGTAWQYGNDPSRFRTDLRTYEFVAFQPGTTVYYVRTDVAPGMKVPDDIVRAQGLIAGGNGVHNARDLLIRLGLDILGVPHKYVTGYRSGQTARLALQRNEVNYYAEPASAYRGAVEAQVIKPGTAIPIYVDPIYNGESLSNSPQVAGMPIPAFQDLYRKIKGAPPSGQMWDIYLSVLGLTSAMGRVVALPPQTPEAAVIALRNATARLNNDKAFADDAMKALGFVPDFVTGADTNRLARQTLNVRPEVRAFVADYIKRANK
jgi:tripartite-type tricarboxylate transporter receptor subunit TctC